MAVLQSKPRPLDQNAPVLQDETPKTPGGAEATTDAADTSPWAAPETVKPTQPVTQATQATKPTGTMGSGGAETQPITQLPDGTGGVVPIPPVLIDSGATSPVTSTVTSPVATAPVATEISPMDAAQPISIDNGATTAPWETQGNTDLEARIAAGAPTAEQSAAYEAQYAAQRARQQMAPPQPLAPNVPVPGATSPAPWEAPAPPPVTLDAAGTMAPEKASAPWEARPESQPESQPESGTFSAADNLVNRQINPTASQRTLNLQNAEDAQLGKLANGPDRFGIAKQQYDDFTKQAESDFRRRRIDETNRAGEGGYLGSGRLSNAYGDLTERMQQNDLSARRGFLNDALTGTIGDNRENLRATSGLSDSSFRRDAQSRNETRDERGYQRGLAEQAIMRRMQQQAAEQGLTQQEFENSIRQYQLGNQNDPTDQYASAADRAAAESAGASGNVGDLFRTFANRRNPVTAG